jgi:hypothetical protein
MRATLTLLSLLAPSACAYASIEDTVGGDTFEADDTEGIEASSELAPEPSGPAVVSFTIDGSEISPPIRLARSLHVEAHTAPGSADATIARVELYDGEAMVAETNAENLEYDWLVRRAEDSDGLHVLRVRAHDDQGRTTTSEPLMVQVDLPESGTPLWSVDSEPSPPGHDRWVDVALGPVGEIVAVGTHALAPSESGAWIRRYAADGDATWERKLPTQEAATLRGVAIAPDGTIAAVGSRADAGWVLRLDDEGQILDDVEVVPALSSTADLFAVDFGHDGSLAICGRAVRDATQGDGYIAQLDSDTLSPRWDRYLGGDEPREDLAVDLAVDDDGTIVVAGTLELESGTEALILRRYTQDGLLAMSRIFPPTLGDRLRATGLALAPDAIYVAGDMAGGWRARFDRRGNLEWSRHDQSFEIVDVAADGLDGAIFVGAYETDVDAQREAVITKRNPAGNLSWQHMLGSSGDDQSHAVAIDLMGYAAVVGQESVYAGGVDLRPTLIRLHP